MQQLNVFRISRELRPTGVSCNLAGLDQAQITQPFSQYFVAIPQTESFRSQLKAAENSVLTFEIREKEKEV